MPVLELGALALDWVCLVCVVNDGYDLFVSSCVWISCVGSLWSWKCVDFFCCV